MRAGPRLAKVGVTSKLMYVAGIVVGVTSTEAPGLMRSKQPNG